MGNSWWVLKCSCSRSRTKQLSSILLSSTADWSADKRHWCWRASLEVGFCFKSFLFSFNLWWSSSSCLSSSDFPTAFKNSLPQLCFHWAWWSFTVFSQEHLSIFFIGWILVCDRYLRNAFFNWSVNGWQIMNGGSGPNHQMKVWASLAQVLEVMRGFNRIKNRGAVQYACWRCWQLRYNPGMLGRGCNACHRILGSRCDRNLHWSVQNACWRCKHHWYNLGTLGRNIYRSIQVVLIVKGH